jgi:hypothetical protein
MMSDIRAQSAAGMTEVMEALRSGAQGGINNNYIINADGITREIWWNTWEGQRSLPPGYPLVSEARPGTFFGLWFCGSRQERVRPYYLVDETEWSKQDSYKFSKAKQVMKYFAGLIKDIKDKDEVSEDVKQSCATILTTFSSTKEMEEDRSHTKLYDAVSKFLLRNPTKEEPLFQALYNITLSELQVSKKDAGAIKAITTLYKKISLKRKTDTGGLRGSGDRQHNPSSRRGQKLLFSTSNKRPRLFLCGCNQRDNCVGLRMHAGYNEKEKCTSCNKDCWGICVSENGVCRGCASLANID